MVQQLPNFVALLLVCMPILEVYQKTVNSECSRKAQNAEMLGENPLQIIHNCSVLWEFVCLRFLGPDGEPLVRS